MQNFMETSVYSVYENGYQPLYHSFPHKFLREGRQASGKAHCVPHCKQYNRSSVKRNSRLQIREALDELTA